MKYGSPIFLEPSGPVQARNGIALPLPLCFVFLSLRLYISAQAPAFLIDN